MGGRRVAKPKPAPRFEGFKPSSERASKTAKAIGRKDTKAELALRKALTALGMRYRLHRKDLPGKPDIVFPKAKVAVFIDGDFWHGRDWEARKAKLKKGANAPYWLAKIAANMERDRRKVAELGALQWRVVRLWEKDILGDPVAVAHAVAAALSS